jgi:hypothetical protein
MGITEVRREIRTALLDNHLTDAEATRIHKAAEKSYDFEVAGAVRDLFDKAHDGDFTAISPGVTPTATTEKGATLKLWGLMLATATPVGDHSYIKQQLILAMDWAPARPCAAPSTAKMFPVLLGSGTRGNGEVVTQTGFVDVARQEAFRRTDHKDASGAVKSHWEGPYAIRQLGGTSSQDIHYASTPSKVRTPEPVSQQLQSDAAKMWMGRYVSEPMTAAAPRGKLHESFVAGHAKGTDSVVTRGNDESQFWIKRVKIETGKAVFAGPFAADI